MSGKDEKLQCLHELTKSKFLVSDKNSALCLYIPRIAFTNQKQVLEDNFEPINSVEIYLSIKVCIFYSY